MEKKEEKGRFLGLSKTCLAWLVILVVAGLFTLTVLMIYIDQEDKSIISSLTPHTKEADVNQKPVYLKKIGTPFDDLTTQNFDQPATASTELLNDGPISTNLLRPDTGDKVNLKVKGQTGQLAEGQGSARTSPPGETTDLLWIEGPNGKEYTNLNKPHQNKENSRRLCLNAGGILPEPKNRDEYDFVKAISDSSSYLGVNIIEKHGRLVFDSDGASVYLSDWRQQFHWNRNRRKSEGRVNLKCLQRSRRVLVESECNSAAETVICERQGLLWIEGPNRKEYANLNKPHRNKENSRRLCLNAGGILPEPKNRDEYNFVKAMSDNSSYLGVNIIEKQGRLVFDSDGASVYLSDWRQQFHWNLIRTKSEGRVNLKCLQRLRRVLVESECNGVAETVICERKGKPFTTTKPYTSESTSISSELVASTPASPGPFWEKGPNGKEYTNLNKPHLNKEISRILCQNAGGILPEPRNRDEYDYVSAISDSSSYLGVNIIEKQGRWVFDSDGRSVDLSAWSQQFHSNLNRRKSEGRDNLKCLKHLRRVLVRVECNGVAETVICERQGKRFTTTNPYTSESTTIASELETSTPALPGLKWIEGPNGKEYIDLKTRKNKENSKRLCQRAGGILPEPKSRYEKKFLKSVSELSFYLGLTHKANDDNLVRDSDGTSFKLTDWMKRSIWNLKTYKDSVYLICMIQWGRGWVKSLCQYEAMTVICERKGKRFTTTKPYTSESTTITSELETSTPASPGLLWREGPNGKEYANLNKPHQNKENSRRLCQNAGGYLPEPKNRVESRFVKAMSDSSFYLGVNRKDRKQNWVLDSDGTIVYFAFFINPSLWNLTKPIVRDNMNCLQRWRKGWVESECTGGAETVICERQGKRFTTAKPYASESTTISAELATSTTESPGPLWMEGPNGKEYANLNTPHQNKENSRRLCQNAGGFLPEPRNRDESRFLEAISRPSFYLGVHLNHKKKSWVLDSDSTEAYIKSYYINPSLKRSKGRVELICLQRWIESDCTDEALTVICERQGKTVITKKPYSRFYETTTVHEPTTSTTETPGHLWIEGPNGKEYINLKKQGQNKENSRRLCQNAGGILSEPKSHEEFDFLQQTMSRYSFYLGLNFNEKQASWVYDSDGTRVKLFNQLYVRQWTHGGQRCLKSYYRGTGWLADKCSLGTGTVICERQTFSNQVVTCRDGWTSFNGSCYILIDELKTFPDAQEICKTKHQDGHVVFMNSEEEYNFLKSNYKHIWNWQYVWVGAMNKEGHWRFDDQVVDRERSPVFLPPLEYCGAMNIYSSELTNYFTCSKFATIYICEYEQGNTVTTTKPYTSESTPTSTELSTSTNESPGFYWVEGPNGKEYADLNELNQNKENSRRLCQDAGGILPEPKTLDEIDFLKTNLYSSESFYLGVNRNDKKGVYVFDSDGTSANLTYQTNRQKLMKKLGMPVNMNCLYGWRRNWIESECSQGAYTVICERQGCAQGFTRIDGVCYGLFREKKSWEDANASCKAKGGFLAEPKSAREVERVRKFAKENGGKTPWIGGTFRKGGWVWADSGASVQYTDWYQGEPNNGLGNEFCLAVNEWYRWNDASCHWKEEYICQM